MADKIDLKKQHKDLYSASAKQPRLLEVPALQYLMIDGSGDPGGPAYAAAMGALYGLAYTIKFAVKQAPDGVDYAVMPLEGLWWTENMADWSMDDRAAWLWTSMILQPDLITPATVESARTALRVKRPTAELERVRLEPYNEGLVAQIMHIGPYDQEGPTIERLHDFIRESGRELRGRHHEIYLSDPCRSAPDKLKTIIRQPVGG